ncbi:2-(3-amino-3-carboxypropyl)histidine synthase subunit [Candidatus Woesearchaeota archaeon]|nr:2-(3-amino-3-carboxypropyl)histidine synthase subunit [Candidatus Woesearchaeota archaeon]
MKILYIDARSDVPVKLSAAALKKLPKKKFGIVTSIQHLHKIDEILHQIKNSKLAGQVLGCNALRAEAINKDVDAFLFIGTGVFHPLNIAWKTKKPVWIWNPVSKTLTQVEKSEIEKYVKKLQGMFNKFMYAKNVGILTSLKMGQKNLSRAKQLSKRKDKKYYLFIADDIDLSELENFPFVDFWVNTACPRIEANNLINIDDLAEFLKIKFKDVERPIWKTKP